MTDDAARRKTPHLSECGNAAKTPKKPHSASSPYRGEAMRHGDAGEDEVRVPARGYKRKRAAPVARSEELIDRILNAVEMGDTLTAACKREGSTPRSFLRWVVADPELQSRFAGARVSGFDAIADGTIRIADEPSKTKIEAADKRTRIDTRLKLLAKWDPKRYGERLQTAVTDVEGNDVVIPPHTDIEESIIAILECAFARKDLAERKGLSLPHTREQFEYLERMCPFPDYVPHRQYRQGWNPAGAISGPIVEAEAIDPDDGADLA